MAESNHPIDYQPPPLPKRSTTGANFGFGVLTGVVASGIAAGIVYASQNPNVLFYALAALLIGKIAVAVYLGVTGRRPGFGPGLLVSIGVVFLILGGICFAVVLSPAFKP